MVSRQVGVTPMEARLDELPAMSHLIHRPRSMGWNRSMVEVLVTSLLACQSAVYRRKVGSAVTTYWLLFFGSIGILERAHMARVAEAANRIQVGDTEGDVLRTLGKPLSTYERYDGWSILGIGAHPPQWLYGATIDIKRLFISDTYVMASPLPINIRWFSYDDDDLVVDWDSKGKVSKIKIPTIPIDHRADKIMDCIYHWHKIYLTLSSVNR